MTHTIPRNDHYVGGESVVWEFDIEDDGTDKDLTNANVEWYLLDNRGDSDADAILDHTNSDVTAQVSDAANGLVEVELASGATEEYQGSMKWQRLVVEDQQGSTQIWNGRFPIQER